MSHYPTSHLLCQWDVFSTISSAFPFPYCEDPEEVESGKGPPFLHIAFPQLVLVGDGEHLHVYSWHWSSALPGYLCNAQAQLSGCGLLASMFMIIILQLLCS